MTAEPIKEESPSLAARAKEEEKKLKERSRPPLNAAKEISDDFPLSALRFAIAMPLDGGTSEIKAGQ